MSKKQAKFIKVGNKLREKVGYGEISEHVIQQAELIIKNNNADFKTIAQPLLKKLKDAITASKASSDKADQRVTQSIIRPVMELKASGGTFKYELVGHLASIMLSFLEHITHIDDDAMDIINAHHDTLSLIIERGIKGDGGQVGGQLIAELESACNRYYKKNPSKFKNYRM